MAGEVQTRGEHIPNPSLRENVLALAGLFEGPGDYEPNWEEMFRIIDDVRNTPDLADPSSWEAAQAEHKGKYEGTDYGAETIAGFIRQRNLARDIYLAAPAAWGAILNAGNSFREERLK